MKERRRYRRVKFGMKFVYKIMGVKGEAALTSADLSGGGLRLYLDKKIKPATMVELGVSLPNEKQIFFALGKVVWQKELPQEELETGRRYATGIEFLKIDTTNRLRLMRFVHAKIKEVRDAA
jgi:c-di-GMP-binding flagellar brake protein YcgR